MKKLLNYIYTHYNNQIVNENTAIIHIIHHRLCSSRFIAKLLFNVRIDPFITSQKKSFPHLFDLIALETLHFQVLYNLVLDKTVEKLIQFFVFVLMFFVHH